jgi:hypothetical protein
MGPWSGGLHRRRRGRAARLRAREAARQRATLKAHVDVVLICEYGQWQAEMATRRIKKEIIILDDE